LAVWCAAERHPAPDSAGRINRTMRIVAEVLREIALNRQTFVPDRHRSRPLRTKPHKFYAYKSNV
jgi:hypothetical protein